MDSTEIKSGIIAKVFSLIIILLLLGEAIAFVLIVPEFEKLFSGFGANLPILTRIILFSPFLIWLLPLFAIGLMYNGMRRDRGYLLPIFFIFLSGILLLPATWYGLYLPIWEMAEVQQKIER